MLEKNVMKAKGIVPILLMAAAASADARFAWPYPRRAVSPDENGQWIVTNANAWPVPKADARFRHIRTFSEISTCGRLR